MSLSASLPSAHSFPNIHLQQELGRGSEGCVFLATHKDAASSREKTVAVKVMDKRQRRSASFDMVSELQHPNIMPCLAVEEQGEKVAVVMKRAKGGDLHSYVAKNGPIELNQARKLFAQLVSAVAHIHQLGLVHRDIKPENILMNAKHDHIWLCDFGFAELVPVTQPTTPFTKDDPEWDSKVRGTLHYAAPEVLAASSDMAQLMPAADVWSCGVVLAFMITGMLPFHEPSDYDTFHMITTGVWHRPPIVSNNATLKDLFAKLFEMNPATRISASSALEQRWMIQPDAESQGKTASPKGKTRQNNNGGGAVARRRSGTPLFNSTRKPSKMRGLASIAE